MPNQLGCEAACPNRWRLARCQQHQHLAGSLNLHPAPVGTSDSHKSWWQPTLHAAAVVLRSGNGRTQKLKCWTAGGPSTGSACLCAAGTQLRAAWLLRVYPLTITSLQAYKLVPDPRRRCCCIGRRSRGDQWLVCCQWNAKTCDPACTPLAGSMCNPRRCRSVEIRAACVDVG
jgi:hypothetical protein